ncbi:MAG: cupin domain-containing protein [Candidatus Dormibacteraceae bacterium]
MADYMILGMHELEPIRGTVDIEGERLGAGVSVILVDIAANERVRLHRHPYQEILILQEGQATYTVGSDTLDVRAPQVVVVSAQVPHAFVNSGSGPLRQVDIHLNARFVTEWLEPE